MIAACIPTRGLIFTEVVQAVFDNLAGKDARLFTTESQGLPDSLNNLVDAALHAGADWVWIVEEDTVPPVGILDKMLAAHTDYVACDYPVSDGHSCFGIDPETSEIIFTGLGCTLIRASVFASIERPWFACDRNMVEVRKGKLAYYTIAEGTVPDSRGGHDLSFGEKVRGAGVELTGIDGECRHLRLLNFNTGVTNEACHTITSKRPIQVAWSEYGVKP